MTRKFLVSGVVFALALLMHLQCLPVLAAEPLASPAKPAAQMPSQPVRKGEHVVKHIEPTLSFSAHPSDLEISTARVFSEPLLPSSAAAQSGENESLAKTLLSYKKKPDAAVLSDFLNSFPKSRWAPAVELSLGSLLFEQGFLSKAMQQWQLAFDSTKKEKGTANAVARQALAELIQLNARLGNQKELGTLLNEAKTQQISGSIAQKIAGARESLGCMQHRPDIAFRCGPRAIGSILALAKASPEKLAEVDKLSSTSKGTNLKQLKELSEKVGLDYQAAKRGAKGAIVTPAVVHWKLNHFAAILEKVGDKYKVIDPTFGVGGAVLLSAQAIESESDGYFLVPKKSLPAAGWTPVNDAEASGVWGKGVIYIFIDGVKYVLSLHTDVMGGQSCPARRPMAMLSAFTNQATHNISDVPLGYSPPVGPAINFRANYNYLEANQPTTFTFSNLGQDWSMNWVSYLTVDGSQNVTIRVRGGGSEFFGYNTSSQPYFPNMYSQASLTQTGTTAFTRTMPDGSVEVFDQPDGTGRIFMTKVIDPQGNYAALQYDSNFRLTTVTDAIGQQSTISYLSNTVGNAGFYKVSQITDPFSRSCSFAYDAATSSNLLSITDVIGLVSSFAYETGSSFINLMTTPYGSTSICHYVPLYTEGGGYAPRGLRFNFSDGTSSVLETFVGEVGKTYFWDRQATALYPADPMKQIYTHCATTSWLLQTDIGVALNPIPLSDQPPLETATTYSYTNEFIFYTSGHGCVCPVSLHNA